MVIMNSMWYEIIKQVIRDLQQPISYIPWAVVIAVLGFLVIAVASRKTENKKTVVRFFRIVFAVYAIVVIQLAFFSREPGSRDGMNLVLFSTWGYSAVTHAFFIENILMLVPFGILAPICFGWLRPMWKCVLFGGGCSLTLEMCQYITKRGYCELDDVLTNTFGVLCGCLILWLIEHVIGWIKRDR